jgi:hypothetical protein
MRIAAGNTRHYAYRILISPISLPLFHIRYTLHFRRVSRTPHCHLSFSAIILFRHFSTTPALRRPIRRYTNCLLLFIYFRGWRILHISFVEFQFSFSDNGALRPQCHDNIVDFALEILILHITSPACLSITPQSNFLRLAKYKRRNFHATPERDEDVDPGRLHLLSDLSLSISMILFDRPSPATLRDISDFGRCSSNTRLRA